MINTALLMQTPDLGAEAALIPLTSVALAVVTVAVSMISLANSLVAEAVEPVVLNLTSLNKEKIYSIKWI